MADDAFSSLAELKVLRLSRNKLTQFPRGFEQLESLENLQMSGNKLVERNLILKCYDMCRKFRYLEVCYAQALGVNECKKVSKVVTVLGKK